MRVKVLSLAVVLASIVALPVPASQMLAGTFSAPSPATRVSDADFSFLLRDPFLIDEMRLSPVGHVALDEALRAPVL
jgi:hypothetical protein